MQITRRILNRLFPPKNPPFSNSYHYWENRYASGGNSGQGSYGVLSQFKAQIVNDFIAHHDIRTVIEFGCGDGNQLLLARYPQYIGLDVSPTAITLCKNRFAQDKSKSFFLYDPFCFVDNSHIFQADITLSLDVIFHLVEDQVFIAYMQHLFTSAQSYVIIYSVCPDKVTVSPSLHERLWDFNNHILDNFPQWTLFRKIENAYPYNPQTQIGSWSDFYIYQRNPLISKSESSSLNIDE